MAILTKASTIASVLTTELNSLADSTNSSASSALSYVVADSGHRYPLAHITLTLAAQGAARSSGAKVKVYAVCAADGTNYDDVEHTGATLLCSFNLDAVTTARQHSQWHIALPPSAFKIFVRNETGQAFAASGNLIELNYYSDDPRAS